MWVNVHIQEDAFIYIQTVEKKSGGRGSEGGKVWAYDNQQFSISIVYGIVYINTLIHYKKFHSKNLKRNNMNDNEKTNKHIHVYIYIILKRIN